ncbi:hypothetical protein NUW54_g102 [Trametes sanguinea]|uniref:Uncharacterized protein n=1 Tax=Trametes sanguinea TaxID=158606 RepID=A0ACC1QBY5_9APHY|nr:hypothetical protein NUW54_g102 [Trametes sanguinea]
MTRVPYAAAASCLATDVHSLLLQRLPARSFSIILPSRAHLLIHLLLRLSYARSRLQRQLHHADFALRTHGVSARDSKLCRHDLAPGCNANFAPPGISLSLALTQAFKLAVGLLGLAGVQAG